MTVDCSSCRLPATLCVCALVPRLQTRTRLLVVIPYHESRKPSNTGQLAARCVGGTVHIRPKRGGPLSPPVVHPGEQPLVLFPAPNATPITEYAGTGPIALIVPDGTWPQARTLQQHGPLRHHPCVTLPVLGPSEYRLRDEPQPGGLATFEAIARALGILEGKQVETAMIGVFRVMVDRLLWFRGKLTANEVTGGIPAAALANDPRGAATRAAAAS